MFVGMEKKLELKHLAPYLPYGLKAMYTHGNKFGEVKGLSDISEYDDIKIRMDYQDCEHIWMFKPILRPIQYLTSDDFKSDFFGINEQREEDYWLLEAIENGHRFTYGDYQNLTYRTVEFLFKNHFDIFGLINDGLAIDINTL